MPTNPWSWKDLAVPLAGTVVGCACGWLALRPAAAPPPAPEPGPPRSEPVVVLNDEPVTRLVVAARAELDETPLPQRPPAPVKKVAPAPVPVPVAAPLPPPPAPRLAPSEVDLRRSLARVPEVSLDPPGRSDNARRLAGLLPEVPRVVANFAEWTTPLSQLDAARAAREEAERASAMLEREARRQRAREEFRQQVAAATAARKRVAEELTRRLPDPLAHSAALDGMPFRRGADIRADATRAALLSRGGRELRSFLARRPGDLASPPTLAPSSARSMFNTLLRPRSAAEPAHRWLVPAAVPVMAQMLQSEAPAARGVLIDLLSRVPGRESAAALAKRAVFDLDAGVRRRAVDALARRDPAEARPVLLKGLAFPWAPAAENAADALLALGDRDAVPELRQLAAGPDPGGPADGADGRPRVRQLVKVNHLRNCHLCHAPAADRDDPVSGLVPRWGEAIRVAPSSSGGGDYYHAPATAADDFVRADSTYLEPEFSVSESVASAAPWPTWQRFDYVVRTVPADGAGPPAGGSPQLRAVRRALAGLSPERAAE